MQGLTWESVTWAWTTLESGNWHPVTWMSLMLDSEMFGPDPRAFHLTNLALHVGSVLSLFLLLRAMTGHAWRSALAAAVFAVHPLRVESVAWVAERKDVLGVLFGLLAIWAYVHYARRPSKPRFTFVLLSFLLSLLAKPLMVSLPLLLLLLDFWPLRRLAIPSRRIHRAKGSEPLASLPFSSRPLRGLMIEKAPLLVLSVASSVMTLIAQQSAGSVESFQSLGLGARAANALVSYLRYLEKTVWPVGLAPFYPFPGRWAAWLVVAAAATLAAITAFAFREAPRRPFLLAGWLWFLGAMVPMIGFIQVGEQAMADRYSYLPSIGLLFMAGWLVPETLFRRAATRRALAMAAAGLLGLLSFITARQVDHWRDSGALWEHTLRVTEGNYIAHSSLGAVLSARGNLDEAIRQYQQALESAPRFAYALAGLATVQAKEGRQEEAIANYGRALAVRPRFPEAHDGLAVVLAKRGELDEAVRHLELAIAARPDFVDAHNNLGAVLSLKGRLGEAVQHYEQALRLEPTSAEAHTNLAMAFSRQGRIDEAIEHFQQALRLSPSSAPTHSGLATVLARQGRLGDAIAEWREALRLDPSLHDAQINLGRVLAAQGKLKEPQEQ